LAVPIFGIGESAGEPGRETPFSSTIETNCEPGKDESSPFSPTRLQMCWPFLVVIPVPPFPSGLLVETAGKLNAAPEPEPNVPVLDIVGQVPAIVPTTVYGPEPVTDTAVKVAGANDVPPDDGKFTAYCSPGERPGDTGTLVVILIFPLVPLEHVAVIPVC
jgi:hypothetical protein